MGKLKWVTKGVSFSYQDSPEFTKSVSFPPAFRQLSVSFPSAFCVTRFRLPVSGPLSTCTDHLYIESYLVHSSCYMWHTPRYLLRATCCIFRATLGRLVMANRKCTIRSVSYSTLHPGCFRFLIGGLCLCAESAKRDETPWSIYDGPLATAWYTPHNVNDTRASHTWSYSRVGRPLFDREETESDRFHDNARSQPPSPKLGARLDYTLLVVVVVAVVSLLSLLLVLLRLLLLSLLLLYIYIYIYTYIKYIYIYIYT